MKVVSRAFMLIENHIKCSRKYIFFSFTLYPAHITGYVDDMYSLYALQKSVYIIDTYTYVSYKNYKSGNKLFFHFL